MTKETKILDVNQLRTILPHRYPFLLLDRVLDYETAKSLTAIKNVSVNEPFFNGHFPETPVFPGVLILEALAQAAGVLTAKTMESLGQDFNQYLYLFAGVNKARFKRIVQPGDQLHLQIDVIRYRESFAVFDAVASVDGELACKAELMSARKPKDEVDNA